ncbi:spindle and kinetochore-associated protein 2 isoform X1 [Hippoglossus hippoglossus]|uniref:spindle and kinetochore-associated protein 2 isoform X1 n=1 Tax=Hippoglossus hippoglossus TaxID=8267 RepID=UPI00148B5DDE|nr:spindle and kinetochore-associated protein 2 isoform X1 [Hippoglossus hippoglossus]XP_034463592.1 spindle and kinetochore-associated protein 2 isoform X1 [Hippoglossus hippoglossus]XP_035035223.1 spindle and kinetochore-associated protein 2 isoform X1 [Hippoglossus stenolepis]
METTVDKLEAMFLKSEADLEYIEKRLKLDFINRTAENGCSAEENPALMLENLRALKAKHTALCSDVKEITAAQKESMDSIKNNLGNVMKLIQHLQQTTDVKVEPLTKSEQEAAEILASALSQTTTEQKFSVPSLLHQGSQ